MKAWLSPLGGILLATLAVQPGCHRSEPPPPPAPSAAPEHLLAPWTWHKLGGLLVVVGEVDEPTDLVLKGRYLNDRMHAEFGPVRWELYAPPLGEIAELRTQDGKLLARWDFSAPAPKPAEAPKPLPKTKPAPKPIPKPAPVVKKTTPPPVPPVQPIPPVAVPKQVPKSRAASSPWPETHLPLVHGPAVKRARARKPAPAPIRAEPIPTKASAPPPLPPAAPLARALPIPPAPLTALPGPAAPSSPAKEWPGSGEALNLIRGPRGSHWVCMTFDGGSTSEVALEVLDALRERNIRTTFFLTGAFIQKYPDLVHRMDHDGHEIGNHTLNHPHFAPGGRRDPRWTKARFQEELLQADSLLLKLLGRPMDPYWRAPYGESTAELRKWAEELGYRHVYWSEGADTLDWATTKERRLYRTGNAILDRLYSRMEKDDGDGLIVLMHLGSGRPEADRPARVLGPFLDKALEEGWNFVNISAYLKEAGKPQWNSSNRLAKLGQNAPRQ